MAQTTPTAGNDKVDKKKTTTEKKTNAAGSDQEKKKLRTRTSTGSAGQKRKIEENEENTSSKKQRPIPERRTTRSEKKKAEAKAAAQIEIDLTDTSPVLSGSTEFGSCGDGDLTPRALEPELEEMAADQTPITNLGDLTKFLDQRFDALSTKEYLDEKVGAIDRKADKNTDEITKIHSRLDGMQRELRQSNSKGGTNTYATMAATRTDPAQLSMLSRQNNIIKQ